MTLVLVDRPQLDSTNPTATLTTALQTFEDSLTIEQRLVYQSSYVKPSPGDVIAFVSRIDADNKGRARKCVAPRLCSFLNRAVQFTSVVETFVNSNPATACLVWGSLKTAFLAASNISSYFDKITSLIIQIGRDAPTLEQFSELYSESVGVQAALCAYYAVIVRLCKKIITVAKRSGITQTLSPLFNPFEVEFKSFVDDLKEAGLDVRTQISLSLQRALKEEAQLAKHERDQNSLHRRLVQDFHKNAWNDARGWQLRKDARQLARLRAILLQRLSGIDQIAIWRHVKMQLLPGTAEWYKKDENYIQWRKASATSMLLCTGKLGCGKSVLASNIVSELLAARSVSELVLYYFCQTEISDSLAAEQIMGSVCRQLLEAWIQNVGQTDIEQLLERCGSVSAEDMLKHVISYLKTDAVLYIVIDGLDECETGEIRRIGRLVTSMMENVSNVFKIVFTGRAGLENNLFMSVQPNHRLVMNSESIAEDVSLYIRTVLDQKLESGELKVGDPLLVIEIQEALQKGTIGMFLWTRFALEEICEQPDDQSIRRSLSEVPKDLTGLIDAKITRIRQKRSAAIGIKVLQYCGVTRRPLTLYEMRELISVKSGQTSLDRTSLVNDVHHLVNVCCGLLYLDEDYQTMQFVHSSVKAYLFVSVLGKESVFNKHLQEQHLGISCLTYLNFTDFDERIVNRSKDADTAINILEIGLNSILAKKSSTKIARYLLQGSPMMGINAQHLSGRLQSLARSSTDNNDIDERYAFRAYAKQNWIYHCKSRDYFSNLPNFIRCLKSTSLQADRPWEDLLGFIPGMLTPQPFAWAIQNKISSLLDPAQIDHSRASVLALFDACSCGYGDMAKMLSQSACSWTPTRLEINWFLLTSQDRDYKLATECMLLVLKDFKAEYKSEYLRYAIWHSIILNELQVTLLLLQTALEHSIDLEYDIMSVLLRHAIITSRFELLELLLHNEDFDGIIDLTAFDKIVLVKPTVEDMQLWPVHDEQCLRPCQKFDLHTYGYLEREPEPTYRDDMNHFGLAEICKGFRYSKWSSDVPNSLKNLDNCLNASLHNSNLLMYYAVLYRRYEAVDIIASAKLRTNELCTVNKRPLLSHQVLLVAIQDQDLRMLDQLLDLVSGGIDADWRDALASAIISGSVSSTRRLLKHLLEDCAWYDWIADLARFMAYAGALADHIDVRKSIPAKITADPSVRQLIRSCDSVLSTCREFDDLWRSDEGLMCWKEYHTLWKQCWPPRGHNTSITGDENCSLQMMDTTDDAISSELIFERMRVIGKGETVLYGNIYELDLLILSHQGVT